MSLIEVFVMFGTLHTIYLIGEDKRKECLALIKKNEAVMAYLTGRSLLTFQIENGELGLVRVEEPGGTVLRKGATQLLAEIFEVKFVDNS
jgi:hypothetical protein